MKTKHINEVERTILSERPKIPYMRADMLVKGKYREGDKMCMTGWMLETFLGDVHYVKAYKEFRTKMMDILYETYSEDHASNPHDRANVWNDTALALGYIMTEYPDGL